MADQVLPPYEILDKFDATTGWTVLSNDTTTLATSTKHVTGTNSLSFAKVDGAANGTAAGIQKTLDRVTLNRVSPRDTIRVCFYLSSIADVAYVFVRLGTNSTNYNEWRVDDADITAGAFNTADVFVGEASHAGITGNGWDPTNITYACVGVEFDGEDDALAGILFDHLAYQASIRADLSVQTEVTLASSNVGLSSVTAAAADMEAFGVHPLDHPIAAGDPLSIAGTSRQDTPSSLSGTSGDYQPLITDAEGKLWVTGAYPADAAAGAGDRLVAVGAIRDDALGGLSAAPGDYVQLVVDAYNALHVSSAPKGTTLADTPTLDTSGAYAADDVLHVAAEIASAAAATGKGGVITGVTIVDDDDQHASGNAMDILFFDATVTATHNVALSLSDADADNFVGKIEISAGDWVDAANAAICFKEANMRYKCAATSLFYVTVLRSGTPTHTASGMEFKFHIEQD